MRHWNSRTRRPALAALGVSAVACWLVVTGVQHAGVIGDSWIVALTVATTVLAFAQGGRVRQAAARRAWRLVGLSQLCQVLAQVAFLLAPRIIDRQVAADSSTVLHILSTAPLVAATLLFRSRLGSIADRTKFALDVGVSLLLGAMMSWFLLRHSSGGVDLVFFLRETPALLVLPGLELLTLVAFGSLYARIPDRESRWGVLLFASGLSAQFLCHAFEAWQPGADTVIGTLFDGTGALLVMLGTLSAYNSPTRKLHEPPVVPGTLRNSVLPYSSVLVGSVMLIEFTADAGNDELTTYLAVMLVMMVLVIARQAITVREDAVRSSLLARVASETRFQSLVQHSSDLVTIIDGSDTIRYTSPAITRVFGYEPSKLEGRPLRELVHPDDVVAMLQFLSDAVKPGQHADMSHWRMRHAGGSWCRVENVAVNLLTDPTVSGLVLTTRDVTQRVALEDQLVHRAFHDGLTGLANRALFSNRVEQAMLRASRTALRTTVLFLDLDDFKEINDSLGHAAGDSLLMLGADRLRACLRAGDTAARLGGDEFAVLLEECDDDGEEAMHIAARISQAFARSFVIEDREAFSTASIGVAISATGDTAEDLLRNADLAMYLAKRRGKARVEQFARHMHDEVVERLDLLSDLRCAIERNELQLEYQPIVDLETRTVTGLETLVRWNHPKRGLISPVDFIPLAEQSGLIVAIGRWVLLHACAHARHWSRTLPELQPVTVTVNLSARQLGDVNLLDDVANALRVAGLRRNQLVLELTESTLLGNSEETVSILTALKALGVRLAIDDFGTGYSSLSYLHRFPVDVLKIDRSFVEGVADGPGGSALASAVVALGNSLGLRTVAEGIENEAQFEVLASLGCKFGQGFLFSRPLPPSQVINYLMAHGQPASDGVANGHRALTPLFSHPVA